MRPRPPPQPPASSLQHLLTTTDPATLATTFALGIVLIYVLLTNLTQPVYSFLLLLGRASGEVMGIDGREGRERLELLFGGLGGNSGGRGGIVSRVWGIFSNSVGVGAGNGVQYGDERGASDEFGTGVCGLYNQGNTCYQNSVLQAMASLRSWRRHLDAVTCTQSEDGEPRLVVVAALQGVMRALNTFGKPLYVPEPLSGGTERGAWIYNEQQDAQEFFQKMTAGVEREVGRLWEGMRMGRRGLGLGEAVRGLSIGEDGVEDKKGEKEEEGSSEGKEEKERGRERVPRDAAEHVRRWVKPEELQNPFQGSLAQRVGCLMCGYVEAIRLQSFTSLSLSLPSEYDCTLEECLAEYTLIEHIPQVNCDKCTLLYHRSRLSNLLETLPTSSSPTSPPLWKETLSSRLEIVNQAIAEDDFSSGVFERLAVPKGQRVSVTKTKQTMIVRLPMVLVCHLNRSQFDIHSGVVRKNFAGVKVPLWLDIEAVPGVVVGGGDWEVDPAKPISSGVGAESGGGLYELRGLVTHYGAHHNGHYICYRKTGKRWWRISDHQVYRVMAAEVEGVMNGFMAFYERVIDGEVLGRWRRRREEGRKMAKEIEGMNRVLGEGRKEGELGVEMPRAGGVEVPGEKAVGVGFSVGGLGLGLSIGKGKFGSDSDVDAVLMALGVRGLVGEAGKKEEEELDVEEGGVNDKEVEKDEELEVEVEEEKGGVEGQMKSEDLPLDYGSALPAAGPLTPTEELPLTTTDTKAPQKRVGGAEGEKGSENEQFSSLPEPDNGEGKGEIGIGANTVVNGTVMVVVKDVAEEDTKTRPETPTSPVAPPSLSTAAPPKKKREKRGKDKGNGGVVNGSVPVDAGKEEGGKAVLVS